MIMLIGHMLNTAYMTVYDSNCISATLYCSLAIYYFLHTGPRNSNSLHGHLILNADYMILTDTGHVVLSSLDIQGILEDHTLYIFLCKSLL